MVAARMEPIPARSSVLEYRVAVMPDRASGRGSTAGAHRTGALFWLAGVLAACGSATVAASRTCPPTPAPARASQAAISASADRAFVALGQTATFTVIAQGSVSYTASCGHPLQLLVADASQLQVYSGTSAAGGGGSPCGAVSLGPSARAVYAVTWPVESTLPGGTYTATLLLGDRAPLVLSIAVGAQVAGCGT